MKIRIEKKQMHLSGRLAALAVHFVPEPDQAPYRECPDSHSIGSCRQAARSRSQQTKKGVARGGLEMCFKKLLDNTPCFPLEGFFQRGVAIGRRNGPTRSSSTRWQHPDAGPDAHTSKHARPLCRAFRAVGKGLFFAHGK